MVVSVIVVVFVEGFMAFSVRLLFRKTVWMIASFRLGILPVDILHENGLVAFSIIAVDFVGACFMLVVGKLFVDDAVKIVALVGFGDKATGVKVNTLFS